jgi:hypothetical protein
MENSEVFCRQRCKVGAELQKRKICTVGNHLKLHKASNLDYLLSNKDIHPHVWDASLGSLSPLLPAERYGTSP